MDYFTHFNDLTYFDLHNKVIDLVKADHAFWIHVAAVVLPLRPIEFDDWLTLMENPLQSCDELFLFMLNCLHLCHMVVFTGTQLWSTICTCKSTSDDQLYAESDLHLVYLRQDVYRELKEKPLLYSQATNSTVASESDNSREPQLSTPSLQIPQANANAAGLQSENELQVDEKLKH